MKVEMKGFKDWINTHQGEDGLMLRRLWEVTDSYKKGYHPDLELAHKKFMDRVGSGGEKTAVLVPMKNRNRILSVAAVIAVLLVSVVGLKQLLDDGSSMERIVTSTTEQKDLSLEDGTVVNLNSNSYIEFPARFDKQERRINLKGEAFFSVAEDGSRPFIISTGNAEIQVLGTAFNVRSSDLGNDLEVFVESGSVEVNIFGEEKSNVLKQGDVMIYNFDDKSLIKTTSNPENANAWKSGKLTFKNAPMGEIFRALERVHGVSILAKDPSLVDCPFTINLNSKDLQSAIKGLEIACDLQFTQKSDKTYDVTGLCCE